MGETFEPGLDLKRESDDKELEIENEGPRIKSESELKQIVEQNFYEECGELGKTVFWTEIYPIIAKAYSGNLDDACARLNEIIAIGAGNTISEIEKTFQTSITDVEMEYVNKSRQEIAEETFGKIYELIVEKQSKFGGDKGVIAVLVCGSFAAFRQTPRSDIDVIYFYLTQDAGDNIGENGDYVHFGNDFSKSLQERVSQVVENYFDAVYIGDEDAIKELAKDKESIIVCPDPEIKAKIESMMKKYVTDVSTTVE